ncbi:aspartate aminotransferase family protein [Pedosphaera parvula]|uniref:Aminotransferase class-III n=1 Tax=Pedosphaera parvula (strain Ellin514) TaxID=320771 RepID=B9XG49_PEDPL|nr:aspartate aminotransferase family protein [Pedosphaera parvula]EEF61211.1 aminotransferase class-III [Pedosphaera parvula Ellin514]
MQTDSEVLPQRSGGLDICALIEQHEGRNYELHAEHINPANVRTLQTIGFDRCYVRGEGPYLWDIEGTKYLDFLSGYGVFGLGRNHPDVRRVLIDFLNTDYPSLVKMEAPMLSGLLAQELKKRMPNQLDMVFFGNSGADGVETAIKYAKCATGKPGIIYCEKAFHGLTSGALSLNGDENFRSGFAPFMPDCRAIPFNDLEALEAELLKGDVAGFIVEPVQGKGVNIPSPGYLYEAAALCHKHGALFIDDEVQTGMGRAGRFLAIEHEGEIDPDIVILSKALSGGYIPISAVLCKKWIHDKVFSSMQRSVVHSSTFSQGNFAMAAGLAALDVIDRYDLIAKAEKLGDFLGHALQAMIPRFEFLHEVRWRGLMMGIEFGPPHSLGLKTAWKLIHTMDKSLFPQAAIIPLLDKHHIITQIAGHHIDVIKLLPPLVISEDDVQWFLGAFEDVLIQMHRFPGPAWDVLTDIGRMALTHRAR